MIITMSDYLLEQEISTASCEDIVLEQYMAELEVANAVIAAYSKQITMLEYASENSAFFEDTNTDKPGIFKRIGSAIKKAWIAFLDWCSMIWGKIKGFFSRNKNGGNASTVADEIAKKLENMPEEEKKTFKIKSHSLLDKIQFLKSAAEQIDELLELFDEILLAVADNKNAQTTIDSYQRKLDREMSDWKALINRYSSKVTTKDGKSMYTGTSSSAAEELDYDQALNEVHEIQKTIDDKFKEKLQSVTEKTKAVKSKITNQMSSIDLSTGKVTVSQVSNEQEKGFSAMKTVVEKLNAFQTQIMKDINDAVKSVENGLNLWRDRLTKKQKAKDIQDGRMSRTITDKMDRGDQLTPEENKYLSDHPELRSKGVTR